MNYNMDVGLWKNYQKHLASLPNGGAQLSVHDGHIGNGREILARFPTQQDALRCMKEAGFKKIAKNIFKAR